MPFTIDDAQHPLVRITYPELASHEEIAAYGVELERVLGRGRLATIVDVRQVAVLQSGAEQRRFLAAQVDAATTRHPGALVAEAVVLTSKVLRAAYTAFNWLRRDSSYPSHAFTTLEEAERWARARLLLAGLQAP